MFFFKERMSQGLLKRLQEYLFLQWWINNCLNPPASDILEAFTNQEAQGSNNWQMVALTASGPVSQANRIELFTDNWATSFPRHLIWTCTMHGFQLKRNLTNFVRLWTSSSAQPWTWSSESSCPKRVQWSKTELMGNTLESNKGQKIMLFCHSYCYDVGLNSSSRSHPVRIILLFPPIGL